MKEFDEIKKLWHTQQTTPAVSLNTVLKGIKSSKRRYVQKLMVQTVLVAVVLLTVIAVWLFVPFVTWTSHLALLMITCCVGYYFIVQVRDYKRVKDDSFLFSQPEEYIRSLRAYKAARLYLHTRNYRIYLLCISLAMALYAIEMYFILPVWLFVGYLLFTALWIGCCHFIFIKNYRKRENERLQHLIRRLEDMQRQFSE